MYMYMYKCVCVTGHVRMSENKLEIGSLFPPLSFWDQTQDIRFGIGLPLPDVLVYFPLL